MVIHPTQTALLLRKLLLIGLSPEHHLWGFQGVYQQEQLWCSSKPLHLAHWKQEYLRSYTQKAVCSIFHAI